MRNSLATLAIATSLALSGLGFSCAAIAGPVTLYTSNSEDSVAFALDIIRQKAPDIRVNVITGSSGALLRRIQAETSNPSADLFWSSGFSTLAEFKELFTPYDSPEASSLFPALRPNGQPWSGTNTQVMVLMVNNSVLEGEAPKSWADILDDDWTGKVTMADPANSSAAYAQLYGIYKLYGEDGVRKLAKIVELQGETSGAYRAVAQGEYSVGMTMEYAAQRYVANGQQEIRLVYPSDGTFLSPEGMGLTANAPHPEDAKRVFDIFLSRELQEGLVGLTFRRPSRSDVDEALKASGLPVMDDIKIVRIDEAESGAARERLLDLWAKARG